jgi:hypothetical protein
VSGVGVRVGVGARFQYDGELVEVVELFATAARCEVLVRDGRGRVARLALRELLQTGQVVPDGPGPAADDEDDPARVKIFEAGVSGIH